ncbi:MAG: hypothetical protein LBH32_05895 [Dysgonamonadaceae bacterium]|jgi:pyruvate-ferredoxin/flavodoxin oxidoreductase|nr:hypothetical protein [Dysgonamonadaceae bacterium]
MALRSALGSRLDSKEPDWTKFQDFLKGEVRFASLLKQFPNAKWRLNVYKRLAA